MEILLAFLIGGAICLIAQLLMDLTPFTVTPAHVLVGFVTLGAVLSALGLYQPLVDVGGAGATIPLSGFGHNLAQGVLEGVRANGVIGAFAGGLQATAAGVVAAVVFGYVMAVIFKPQG